MGQARDGRKSGWRSSTQPSSAWTKFDQRKIAARVAAAVSDAREVLPSYGTGKPATSRDIDTLLAACSIRVLRADIRIPADTWPPLQGVVHLFVDYSVGPDLLRYIQLHEIGHRLAGDLDEPTKFVFHGPLPEAEEVADLFALVGILDAAEIAQGPEFVETRIRELVPLDNYGWQTYRIPRLAGNVVRLQR